jgi:hypothetical protein
MPRHGLLASGPQLERSYMIETNQCGAGGTAGKDPFR